MNPKKYLPILCISAALLACDGGDGSIMWSSTDESGENIGYRPVYGEPSLSTIVLTDPQAIQKPGKIYVYGKYLLINERQAGIHVYDNADAKTPSPIGFIRILGNTDMAIKDDILYADHMGNLVALTLDDFKNVAEKGRLELANWNLGVPPPARFAFECVDQSKGLVVAWKKTDNKNLNCYALR